MDSGDGRVLTRRRWIGDSGWPRGLAPLAMLALAMAAMVILVPPAGEFPIDDDWVYTRTVQRLLETGRLEVPAWTAATLVLQALWGASFALLFGHSHAVLRVSTLVLAALAIVGCFVLLRDLLGRERALVGALLLLFNPLFVFLSYSFMTDVPFLALALWAQVCYVRAFRGVAPVSQADRPGGAAAGGCPDAGWIAAGSALAGGAFLIRQFGAALPLALLGGLLVIGGRRMLLRPCYLGAALGPFLPALFIAAYFDHQRGALREVPLLWTLEFWSTQGLGMASTVLARLGGLLSTLGLFALPLSLGALRLHSPRGHWSGRLALPCGIVLGAGLAINLIGSSSTALLPHLPDLLHPHGFAVHGRAGTLPDSVAVPEPLLALATLGALLGGGLLLLATLALASWTPLGLAAWLTTGAERAGLSVTARGLRDTLRGPAIIPLLFALQVGGASLVSYDFYDRYLLPLLPAVFILLLLAVPLTRHSLAVAIVGALLLGGWSAWWERDYLDRRAALWRAGLALVERGIPAEEIENGYEWGGWHRGEATIATVVRDNPDRPTGLWFSDLVLLQLRPETGWVVVYGPPPDAVPNTVLTVVPYGRASYVAAIQLHEPGPASASQTPDCGPHGAMLMTRVLASP